MFGRYFNLFEHIVVKRESANVKYFKKTALILRPILKLFNAKRTKILRHLSLTYSKVR